MCICHKKKEKNNGRREKVWKQGLQLDAVTECPVRDEDGCEDSEKYANLGYILKVEPEDPVDRL